MSGRLCGMNEHVSNLEPLLTKKIQTGITHSDERSVAETLFDVSCYYINKASTVPI